MTVIQLTAIIGLIVAAICLIDAFKWNRSPQTLYRFFLLNGKLKIGGFVSTILAANLSLGNFLIFIATWGYLFGISGLIWFSINLVLNVVGFRLFFRHFKSYIEDHNNSGTIHDFLSQSYAATTSKSAAAIRLSASLVTVIGLLLSIVFELSIAVSLMAPVSQFQQITIFLSLTVIICVFTAYGGFRTLVISDVCQASILFIGTIALLVIMLSSGTGISPLFTKFNSTDMTALGWPGIVSICVIGTGWLLVAMDQWQRTCASRSYSTSKKGVMIYLGFIILFALIYGVWGMYDKNVLLPTLDANLQSIHSNGSNPLADIQLISTSSYFQKFIITFITCALIGAGLSTTNTFLTVSSHSLTTDVLLFSLAGKTMQDLDEKQNKAFVGIARTVIVAMGILIVLIFVGLVTSGLLTDPLSFFFIAYSVQFALLAPMITSRIQQRFRPSASMALISIFIGLFTALVVGFGSWHLIQDKTSSILGLPPSDWLTLSPVVCVVAGFIPLSLSMIGKITSKNERSNA